MQVKKVVLAVAVSGAAWGALALPAAAESPPDGIPSADAPVIPGAEVPAVPGAELPAPPDSGLPGGAEAPALPPPLGSSAEAEPEPQPARVSPDDCLAGGGNVERTDNGQAATPYYCHGGTEDGTGIRH